VKSGPQRKRVLLAALFGVVSCTGQIGDPLLQDTTGTSVNMPDLRPRIAPQTPPPPPVDSDLCPSATRQRARRISLGEYERAVADLIGVNAGLTSTFAAESSVHGFDNQADALSVSSGNFEEFATAAQVVAEAVDVTALAPCADGVAPEECASSFAPAFARRAYGRRLSARERGELLALYAQGAAAESYDRGIRTVVEAILISPYFLYRTEIGKLQKSATAELNAHEVANAVAFALTGKRPDAALLARAASDPRFRTPDVLRDEATRLVGTTDSRQHMARFLRGWLGVPDLRAVNKIPAAFPRFTRALKSDLDIELDLFLDYVLREQNGTLQALLGAPVSFASAAVLEAIYAGDYAAPLVAPEAPPPGTFAKIELNPKLRKGVLSLGGWLAGHAPVHRSSPVDRGLAIRTRLLCQPLPSPPPQAVATAPGPGDGVLTTRQKFERHTSDKTCQACHRYMDPIGFGLEMMDALGSFRDTEAGLPVDSRGELALTDVDGPFEGPAELADRLLASRQVRDCFVVQMYRYIEGRDEVDEDKCELSVLKEFFATPGRTMGELATEIVAQPRFSERSVER
jgi:Protein of unknown function (DUF1588)/Protein of unknown function (DUF1592)/Protein of unknown function (DUF1595)/Protein of unknown function (DUF1587)/Protein of unknown function (DUF1585)